VTYGVAVAIHRGKVHDYLEMKLGYSKKGKVMINMMKHINKMVQTSPAADHLFNVRNESLVKPLPEEQARAFHHGATHLLCFST
jgi:hypothetical protein